MDGLLEVNKRVKHLLREVLLDLEMFDQSHFHIFTVLRH